MNPKQDTIERHITRHIGRCITCQGMGSYGEIQCPDCLGTGQMVVCLVERPKRASMGFLGAAMVVLAIVLAGLLLGWLGPWLDR